NESTATIAVSIDEEGTIHAAALRFWHNKQPLKFYFVTGRSTEKYKLLQIKPEIPCACVVGTTRDGDFTLQMRGNLKTVDPTELIDEVKQYYKKRGNRHDDVDDPKNVL